jgi:hypothetical protein
MSSAIDRLATNSCSEWFVPIVSSYSATCNTVATQLCMTSVGTEECRQVCDCYSCYNCEALFVMWLFLRQVLMEESDGF